MIYRNYLFALIISIHLQTQCPFRVVVQCMAIINCSSDKPHEDRAPNLEEEGE